jgi:hypothetical protein
MNYNTVTKLSGFAAIIAAATVSIGATMGFHELTGSWLTAGLIGVTIAVLLGIGWHVLIRSAAHTRRTGNRVGLIGIGAIFVCIALATSGWSLATSIGGKTALEQHQKAALAQYENGLAKALARVNGQRSLVEAVAVARSVYSGRVAAEIAGDNGAAGCGPQCRQLQAASANLTQYQRGVEAQIESASEHWTEGSTALSIARSDIGTANFEGGLAGVEKAMTMMNSINVTDGVSRVGMVSGNANDPLTQNIVTVAKELDVAPVAVPTYTPISKAEATLAYSSAVIGAWIAAVAIDAAPFIFLILVLMLFNEPLIRDQANPKPRHVVTPEEIRAREGNVIGINGVAAE